MSVIEPSDHGIVVENKFSGQRYASLDANFDPNSERKVRDLKPGESVTSYGVKPASSSFKPLDELDYPEVTPEATQETLEGIDTLNEK